MEAATAVRRPCGRAGRDQGLARWRFGAALCGCFALCCQSEPHAGDDAGLLGSLKQWILAGSSRPREDGPHSARAPQPSAQEIELRRQMFERLVNEIRKYHVFSSVWPEAEWAKDLPALEREVLEAPERNGLLLALCHMSNHLRDGHLNFSPCPRAKGPTERLWLPLAFALAGSYEAPQFIVTQAERASGVAPGDVLFSYAGVPSEGLLEHFRFELRGAYVGARLEQLTDLLRSRYSFGQQGLAGTGVTVAVRHGTGLVSAQAHFAAPEPQFAVAGPPLVSAPSPPVCPARARDYGGEYQLVDVGAHVCLYRAARAPFEPYPIVRQLSFLYKSGELAADHARVQAFLAQAPRVAGVLLDLRDNFGGMAADYFLPWYSSGSYRGAKEWVHLRGELDDRGRLRRVLRSNAAVDEYLRRAAGGNGWWVRPFDCEHGDCERARARARHPVTAAPVALLLGPGCRSSCDMFAAIWTRERFGPTVGAPPGAMYTSLRYPLTVALGDELLGDFEIALCGLRLEDDEPWLEGRPLHLDAFVEPRWPERSYDSLLLRAAVRALSSQPADSARAATGR